MTQPADVTRRAVLTLGGAGAAFALASCAATPSAPEAGTQPAKDREAGSGAPAPAPSGSAAGDLPKLSDIPVGGSVAATLDGAPILISQPTAGTVVAFSAICTHQGCLVAPAKNEFDCPCHASRFNSATGAVLGGPALKPLEKVQVSVDGDSIVAG